MSQWGDRASRRRHAAEFRLPIVVPNPAHAQFIARAKSDPVEETRALSATRARQLMGMPAGDSVIEYRDRALLKFYLYSGARISSSAAAVPLFGCSLHRLPQIAHAH